ncbi:MAG: hypothetical protein AB7E05_16175 [Sphingobium sp.]
MTGTILSDVAEIPLDRIDISDPTLYQRDAAAPLFRRLRAEDPVHYCAESRYGPFWSLTKFHDIIQCDSNHRAFSSQGTIILGFVDKA